MCVIVYVRWTYDEHSELVDMEWRLPAKKGDCIDEAGETSTDLWMLPAEERLRCDAPWSVSYFQFTHALA